jgi:hypothetical protein
VYRDFAVKIDALWHSKQLRRGYCGLHSRRSLENNILISFLFLFFILISVCLVRLPLAVPRRFALSIETYIPLSI